MNRTDISGHTIPSAGSVDHVKGRSLFIDSLPMRQDEIHLGLIISSHGSGLIETIDISEIERMPGFIAAFTASDFVNNRWGPVVKDTPFLAEKRVNYAGEPIVLIAFDNKNALRQAQKKVHICLKDETSQAVFTIDQALASNSFFPDTLGISRGNLDLGFSASDHILEGTLHIQGQEHFYFETQAAIAIPEEGGCLKILSSTQHPTEVQHVCAHALGLSFQHINCDVNRMGGAFGGKESQASHIAALAALAAHKTGRPARLVLEREEDMEITGKRHGFLCRYKVGYSHQGKIQALKTELFADGGYYLDLSPAILQRALLHLDNCYYIPHFDSVGKICRTNTAPNTAFRGFGGPQGMAVIENIIEDISVKLRRDSLAIRKINIYGAKPEYSHTPYGQKLENNLLPELFNKLEHSAKYSERRLSIDQFNKENKILVRGLALTGTKFGISFTTRFLNQGNALVHVHRDGSIQVSTGATEMGQGVNSKIQGVVADAFGIPLVKVRVMTTSTEKNANTSPTAASSGSDLNGAAALAACDKIKERCANIAAQWLSRENPINTLEELEIKPNISTEYIVFRDGQVIDRMSKASMPLTELINLCYFNRISLSDYAHYKFPGLSFDARSGQGKPFFYFTQGAAATEVSVDRFTGEVKVIRTDILMDLGRSLNALIDYGQVAGAFVQGLGWVTSEDVYREKGKLISRSPTTYKIPNINDIPREFIIDFLENSGNQINLHGSKAVGEPPLPLALSVWCAIKNALSYIYPDKILALPLPATNEAIIMVQQRSI